MNANDDDGKFTAGYGKPPVEKQFKKGQSGNPKGRPKGRRSTTNILDRILLEPVTVIENGKRKTISKLEAVLKQITNKAVGGEHKALVLFMSTVQHAEAKAESRAITDRANSSSETGTAREGNGNFLSPKTRQELEERITAIFAKSGMRLVPIEGPQEE